MRMHDSLIFTALISIYKIPIRKYCFHKGLDDVARDAGGDVYAEGTKGLYRAWEKIAFRPGADAYCANKICDMTRGIVEFDSMNGVTDAYPWLSTC